MLDSTSAAILASLNTDRLALERIHAVLHELLQEVLSLCELCLPCSQHVKAHKNLDDPTTFVLNALHKGKHPKQGIKCTGHPVQAHDPLCHAPKSFLEMPQALVLGSAPRSRSSLCVREWKQE